MEKNGNGDSKLWTKSIQERSIRGVEIKCTRDHARPLRQERTSLLDAGHSSSSWLLSNRDGEQSAGKMGVSRVCDPWARSLRLLKNRNL